MMLSIEMNAETKAALPEKPGKKNKYIDSFIFNRKFFSQIDSLYSPSYAFIFCVNIIFLSIGKSIPYYEGKRAKTFFTLVGFIL